jgi:hypothetical protein
MRQWTSAFLILIVVAMVAAFAVGSIVAVVHANAVLQQGVGPFDDLAYDAAMSECDPFDTISCL